MKSTESTNKGLRLARMVAEGILKERILPKDGLDRSATAVIAEQLKSVIEEMQAEWETNPESGELKEAFHLLADYVTCLARRH